MKIFFILAALLTLNAHAMTYNPAKVVAHQLQKKLQQAKNAFAETTPMVLRTHDDEAYYMKRIRLQFAPFAEFEIAEIFEIKVQPIIELRWSRKNPAGWSNFKKQNM